MADVGELAGMEFDPAVRYGRRLGRLRGELGLSQRELAAAAGVSQAAVSRAERDGGVDEEALVKIELALGLPDDYPSAPRHPVRRREFFEGRSFAGVPAPPSGTFGAGKAA